MPLWKHAANMLTEAGGHRLHQLETRSVEIGAVDNKYTSRMYAGGFFFSPDEFSGGCQGPEFHFGDREQQWRSELDPAFVPLEKHVMPIVLFYFIIAIADSVVVIERFTATDPPRNLKTAASSSDSFASTRHGSLHCLRVCCPGVGTCAARCPETSAAEAKRRQWRSVGGPGCRGRPRRGH